VTIACNIPELEKLAAKYEGKNVMISDTYDIDGFAFLLAHVIRTFANKTYCVGEKYAISESPQRGYRRIEEGRVYLIRGEIRTPHGRREVLDVIANLREPKPDIEIVVNETHKIAERRHKIKWQER